MTSQETADAKLLQRSAQQPQEPEKQKKDAVPMAPRSVQLLILAVYCALLAFNVYAIWQWDLETMRVSIISWMCLYALDVGIVVFPGWMSAPWVIEELMAHHLISIFYLLMVVIMPPCANQPIAVRVCCIFLLVNWNEATFILTDVLGLSQHDSYLSIVRRVCMPFFLNIESPAMTLFIDWKMTEGLMTTSMDWLSMTTSLVTILLTNAFAWIYYPYVLHRLVKNLRRDAARWRARREDSAHEEPAALVKNTDEAAGGEQLA